MPFGKFSSPKPVYTALRTVEFSGQKYFLEINFNEISDNVSYRLCHSINVEIEVGEIRQKLNEWSDAEGKIFNLVCLVEESRQNIKIAKYRASSLREKVERLEAAQKGATEELAEMGVSY
jgi:hypothetical protein